MAYICTMICENVFSGFKVTERKRFLNFKGHNSVENVGCGYGFSVCSLLDHGVYLCHVL